MNGVILSPGMDVYGLGILDKQPSDVDARVPKTLSYRYMLNVLEKDI